MKATFTDVKREVFEALCAQISDDDGVWLHVTINYNGTNLRGNLTIEGHGGYFYEYVKTLDIFVKEYRVQ